MQDTLNIADFLELDGLLLDVRSPGEFRSGHIPGATSFPLFSDEERAAVGTCYRQQGPHEALVLGLKYVGPKMAGFLTTADQLNPHRQTIRMHCFRGGQRSQSMAWLLRKAGHPVVVLDGGYKAYRRHLLASFEEPQEIVVLSGCTGSGKTAILHRLAEMGEQVVDLEGLASHRGSAFGGYHQPADLTSEMFENRLFEAWRDLDRSRAVWLEDESRSLGKVFIPHPFWLQMRAAPVVFLDVPQQARVRYLVGEYGNYDRELLSGSVDRIAKRLGPQSHAACKEALDEGNYEEVVRITLEYYDKAYRYSLNKRQPELLYRLSVEDISPTDGAERLLELWRDPQKYRVNTIVTETEQSCTSR